MKKGGREEGRKGGREREREGEKEGKRKPVREGGREGKREKGGRRNVYPLWGRKLFRACEDSKQSSPYRNDGLEWKMKGPGTQYGHVQV